MIAAQDFTDDDRKMLRYMNNHVRFWSASDLAPQLSLSVVQAWTRLDALERAGYLRRLGESVDKSEPSFTLTGTGIEAAFS